ncbi:endoplasmic oxidoreductin [Thraustotheca clavata]|uniref:Endoplasmic oxidoreductin n=1 Tax=Thraustotheca clavata TaxID=74557 RepID=A0A1W0A9D1_9STRA|nr:endoplasmic oxidoreductin [Thraustotheca clavata]
MKSLVVSLMAMAMAMAEESSVFNYMPVDMVKNIQCQVCKTPELTGTVTDSCCNYETVDVATQAHFHPLLDELRTLSFFRYYKADLTKECPFWASNNQCANRDCSVCECSKEEIPAKWFEQDAAMREAKEKALNEPCDEQRGEGELSKIDRKNAAVGTNFNPWYTVDKDDVEQDNEDNLIYVNLLENPERFTGYSGNSAWRVWKAIYEENCFHSKELCLEERVYYRLISGLHTSINTHVALDYRFGDHWGPNTKMFVARVGAFPERLQNMYFTYLFVLRAVGRYREVLLNYDYSTGNEYDDKRVNEVLRALFDVDNSAYNASCRAPTDSRAVLFGFNESMLFSKGISVAHQREQFRLKFENVTRIMDCVTCEKCRLWGKIQILGLGTAIKILLADDIHDLPPLQRNEIIALINVLHRLSESIEGVSRFRQMEFEDALKSMAMIVAGAVALVIGIVVWRRRKVAKAKTE